MNRGGERGTVVVAVDDDSADDAVDWAAAEAATRGCRLRVVHAVRPPLPPDPYGVVPMIDSFGPTRAAAELVLRDAVARARSVASDLTVSTRLLLGSAGWTLLREADGAQLLVVGSHRRSGLRGLLAGSTSVHLATHASCPVVVIHPSDTTSAAQPAPRAIARVVVGVDRTKSCTNAIAFAFQAARQRGITLAAVHAWAPDPRADIDGISGPATMAEAFARRAIEQELARWRDEYADVGVVTELAPGDPAQALLAESRGAALVVVGSRGRGQVLGTVLGSVSQTVLRHVRCPIAIVRHRRGTAARPPTGVFHRRAS